jgi:hypothetical protein
MPKTARIEIRLTEDEKAGLKNQAKAAGVDMSDLVRQKVLGQDGASGIDWVDFDRRVFGHHRMTNSIARALRAARLELGL